MSKSMAVFGAGPALGRAVALRYAREGYDVALVARRDEPLEAVAGELRGLGAVAHVITADLADLDRLPQVAARSAPLPAIPTRSTTAPRPTGSYRRST